jgi:hypothetical protein
MAQKSFKRNKSMHTIVQLTLCFFPPLYLCIYIDLISSSSVVAYSQCKNVKISVNEIRSRFNCFHDTGEGNAFVMCVRSFRFLQGQEFFCLAEVMSCFKKTLPLGISYLID